MVSDCKDKYAAASKMEKSMIIRSIVDQVQENSVKGGFIKVDPVTGRYTKLPVILAVIASECYPP